MTTTLLLHKRATSSYDSPMLGYTQKEKIWNGGRLTGTDIILGKRLRIPSRNAIVTIRS